MIKFVDLRPDRELLKDLDLAYYRVMLSGVYVRGAEIEEFEEEWAAYNNAKYCVSCGSGLDALALCLRAYGVGCSNFVSVPSWTASSTWSAVESVGAMPTLSHLAHIRIVVHMYGLRYPSFYDDIPLIQDCAQAHGLKLSGTCCWSFYPTKNLGAIGDGGAITTDNEDLAISLRLYRNHGCRGAINSRLDPLQAAFLRAKLKRLDGWIEQRQEYASLYLEGLQGLPDIELPPVKANEAVWHQFVIETDKRDSLMAWLYKNNIETMIHYKQPPHRELGYDYDLPEADRKAARVLSLPIAPHLRREEIIQVIEVIKEWTE